MIGYCIEKDNLVLVNEYMSGRSVEDQLFKYCFQSQLRLLTGNGNNPQGISPARWARNIIHKGETLPPDPLLNDARKYDFDQAAYIAFLCVQPRIQDRPDMHDGCRALECLEKYPPRREQEETGRTYQRKVELRFRTMAYDIVGRGHAEEMEGGWSSSGGVDEVEPFINILSIESED